jgi:hypothetical protein
MHNYAAATALVIAVNITMLTPAVSAFCPGDGPIGRTYCRCSNQCYGRDFKPGTAWFMAEYLAKVRRCKPGAFCDLLVIPPDIQACLANAGAPNASCAKVLQECGMRRFARGG